MYLDGSNTAAQVMLELYADNGGSPAQLLGAATISSPKAGAWNSVPLTVNICSGQRYWLAILQPASANGILGYRVGGSGNSESSSQTNLMTLPAIHSVGQTWTSGAVISLLEHMTGSSLTRGPDQTAGLWSAVPITCAPAPILRRHHGDLTLRTLISW